MKQTYFITYLSNHKIQGMGTANKFKDTDDTGGRGINPHVRHHLLV